MGGDRRERVQEHPETAGRRSREIRRARHRFLRSRLPAPGAEGGRIRHRRRAAGHLKDLARHEYRRVRGAGTDHRLRTEQERRRAAPPGPIPRAGNERRCGRRPDTIHQAGRYAGILPERALESFQKNSVVAITLPGLSLFTRQIALVYRKSIASNPDAQRLFPVFRQFFSNLG